MIDCCSTEKKNRKGKMYKGCSSIHNFRVSPIILRETLSLSFQLFCECNTSALLFRNPHNIEHESFALVSHPVTSLLSPATEHPPLTWSSCNIHSLFLLLNHIHHPITFLYLEHIFPYAVPLENTLHMNTFHYIHLDTPDMESHPTLHFPCCIYKK